MTLTIVKADYSNHQHRSDIPALLNAYALDPMGGGAPLPKQVRDNLVDELARRPYAFSILAYMDDVPVGLVNCFEAFSSFACKPLINIHDVIVLEEYRSQGISRRMLEQVEAIARAKGCCKLTLEVLSNNAPAKSAYEQFGFSGYQLDPNAGSALFWQKPLTS